ncbi:hypothetical protein IWQ62_002531 [Dispira parvispora]|uniref:Uncharacterized protein n=1 Tax=Dispira parvispora TaxID=1520584 RepID=A0A9W8AQ62_9FUNG|nr:hypothetical protein IWQ62_002531 [Dispira parvispora]
MSQSPTSTQPPADHQGDSSNHTAPRPVDSGLGQLTEVMQSSLGGVQQSLGTLMHTLSSSLQRTMDMAQAMNGLLESYVKHSLRLTTRVTSSTVGGGAQPVITLSIANRSKVPLAGARLTLHFQKFVPGQSTGTLAKDSSVNDSKTDIPLFTTCPIVPLDEKSVFSELSETSHDEPYRSKPFPLDAFATVQERLCVHLPEFHQYQATAELIYPHPGTQQLCRTSHSFGIYLLFQCTRDYHVGPSGPCTKCDLTQRLDSPTWSTLRCHANLLRDIFSISATQGISVGDHCTLTRSGFNMLLTVSEIMENGYVEVTPTLNTTKTVTNVTQDQQQDMDKICWELDQMRVLYA